MTAKPITAAIVAGSAFTVLFYNQQVGLNLLLANILILLLLLLTGRLAMRRNQLLVLSGVVATALGAVVVHSDFVVIMNFASLFLLVGLIVFPESRSVLTILRISAANILPAQKTFFAGISGSRKLKFRRFALYGVPTLIVLTFIWIYRLSSPAFDRGVSAFATSVSRIFSGMDLALPLTVAVSLMLANFVFLSNSAYRFAAIDMSAQETLVRRRKLLIKPFKVVALSNEYRSGIFLLCSLNFLLLALNLTDIYHVWFNFSWDGGYLKQFVHEGTYLLLLSIVLSVIIVLYFFRGNLNFFSKSRWLRALSYIWIVQNAVLAISVGVRNYWYIQYFALAYKRIGLLIFLLLTLYGLYTVFVKVREQKSPFYLLRMNALALYLVLTVSSLFNWDSIIVRYNLGRAGTAFFEFDYNSRFADKALPQLDRELSFYESVAKAQKIRLGLEDLQMSPAQFHEEISRRKTEFTQRWQDRHWLSWNLPEHRAYEQLNR